MCIIGCNGIAGAQHDRRPSTSATPDMPLLVASRIVSATNSGTALTSTAASSPPLGWSTLRHIELDDARIATRTAAMRDAYRTRRRHTWSTLSVTTIAATAHENSSRFPAQRARQVRSPRFTP